MHGSTNTYLISDPSGRRMCSFEYALVCAGLLPERVIISVSEP